MGEYAKSIVALIMAIVAILEQHFQLSLGITEAWVADGIAILTAILVYLVPNRA